VEKLLLSQGVPFQPSIHENDGLRDVCIFILKTGWSGCSPFQLMTDTVPPQKRAQITTRITYRTALPWNEGALSTRSEHRSRPGSPIAQPCHGMKALSQPQVTK